MRHLPKAASFCYIHDGGRALGPWNGERLRPCGGGVGQAKPATPHQRQFAAGVGPRRH